MGFFSSLRRFWSGRDAPLRDEAVSPVPDGAAAPFVPDGEAVSPVPGGDWRPALALALRDARPQLSDWLDAALQGVDETGEDLRERLHFLLTCLNAPEDEAAAFVRDFLAWAERMRYRHVVDFRSELQYRLALALELEDEQDERDRLFAKMQQGLARTRDQFGRGLGLLLAAHGELGPAFWEELTELFIRADMGVETASGLVTRLKECARARNVSDPEAVRPLIREVFAGLFKPPRRITAVNPPEVILVVGVNGSGKTTTIAKLACRARMQGKRVLLVAADTFRAAAVDQLRVWSERVGAGFHAKAEGADPAAVVWEGMDAALAGGHDIVFVDTAGRLHTKTNLMDELKKIRSVLGRKHPGAPHRTILVMDATTGQNALTQAAIFKESIGIDELILTKLDGTAKGGMAVAVVLRLGIPVTYVGLGEKTDDLRPFNAEDFARAMVGGE
jgi:fused signal recognition particle receptor